VYEFGFEDREGDSQIPAPIGFCCVGSLQAADIVPVGL